MTRFVPILSCACGVAILGTGYVLLGAGASEHLAVPATVSPSTAIGDDEMAATLRAARRTCRREPIDEVVQRLRSLVTQNAGAADGWHLLAEALLERCLVRSHLCGMVVGAPSFPELPADMVADIDQGLEAVARARELGDGTGDLPRIEAGLMSLCITSLRTALQWNQKVQEALQQASRLAAQNPHLHVAHGLRKLLSPKLLGHDAEKALEHFEFAAKSLPDDERPAVFAAMASHLQRKRLQAIDWLEQAARRNPDNIFARVVLRRLRRGEEDAFARDVTAAEAADAR